MTPHPSNNSGDPHRGRYQPYGRPMGDDRYTQMFSHLGEGSHIHETRPQPEEVSNRALGDPSLQEGDNQPNTSEPDITSGSTFSNHRPATHKSDLDKILSDVRAETQSQELL